MAIAKVFTHGRRQLVELPPEFHISADEVEVRREGDELVLVGKTDRDAKPYGLRLLELIQSLPEDMFSGIKDDRPPQEREGL